jgi:hypothetical protein
MSENHKKAGRPRGNPNRKAVKPNISLRRDLIGDAEAAASKRGIGLSEYVTMALTKQVARDEDYIDPSSFISGDPTPMIVGMQSHTEQSKKQA